MKVSSFHVVRVAVYSFRRWIVELLLVDKYELAVLIRPNKLLSCVVRAAGKKLQM